MFTCVRQRQVLSEFELRMVHTVHMAEPKQQSFCPLLVWTLEFGDTVPWPTGKTI